MTLNSILLIFLFVQVFIAGILVSVAWRHWRAHTRPVAEGEPEASSAKIPAEMPPELRQHILKLSEEKYQEAVNDSAAQLQKELTASGEQIKDLVGRLATEIVADEMQRYRAELSRMRAQTNIEMSSTNAEIEKHKEEIKAKINQEMEAEKHRLMQQIDTKLGDAVSSFLLEALQHNVDLGNQSSYLVSLLEEHKNEFVKGVVDETQASG